MDSFELVDPLSWNLFESVWDSENSFQSVLGQINFVTGPTMKQQPIISQLKWLQLKLIEVAMVSVVYIDCISGWVALFCVCS